MDEKYLELRQKLEYAKVSFYHRYLKMACHTIRHAHHAHHRLKIGEAEA
jgi:hypothetical protein